MTTTTKTGEILVLNADKIATATGYKPEEIAIIKKQVAKGVDDTELAFFLSVCKSVNLNPFIKEIWCYKDHKKNLLVFAGRDGFRTYAQRNPAFNGLRSSEVCKNDKFILDIAQNKITHEITGEVRGEILGAYAIVFRKDGEASIVWADIKTYDRSKPGVFTPWLTHKPAMIKKVAELMALKQAFGMAGVQSEYDFDVDKGVARPITQIEEIPEEERLMKELLEALRDLSEDDREVYAQMVRKKTEANEITPDFLQGVIDDIHQTLQGS